MAGIFVRTIFTNFKVAQIYAIRHCSCETGRKGVVLGVYTNDCGKPKLTQAAEKFDCRIGGKLTQLLDDIGGLKLGKSTVMNNIDKEFWSVCLVGLGEEGIGYCEVESYDLGKENVRIAAGAGATKLRKEGINTIYIEDMCNHAEQAAEGGTLAVWRFQENMHKNNWRPVPNLELYDSQDTCGWTRGIFKAEAQNLARKLCDMPANQLNPTSFAQAAVDALCPCGVNVEVHDKDWIEDQNMDTFLMAAKGSCEPPVFLELTYCGGGSEKPVVLVGTGLTFDTGGLHLKKCHNMDKYRASVAGGAVVVAAMRAAAALSIPINITGLIPLCENMPSGLAMKPGDVVKALNGRTIVVQNCDNEGHLILADTFIYATDKHKPRMLIDISTMTSCIRAALGAGASGVFANTNKYWKLMHQASAHSGDRVWRMPLWKFYTKELRSLPSVDITNKGHHYGDACIAAAFLNEFVCPGMCWLHMDVTGVSVLPRAPQFSYLSVGRMTGRPTRTIIQFLSMLACEDKSKKDKC